MSAPTPIRASSADRLGAAITRAATATAWWRGQARPQPAAARTPSHLLSVPDIGLACEVLLADRLFHDLGDAERDGLARWIRASQGDLTHQVPVEQVLFFRADDKYTCVRTTGGAEHLIRTTIQELAQALDPQVFVQVHRSTIVNLHHLAGTRRDEASRLFLDLGQHRLREVETLFALVGFACVGLGVLVSGHGGLLRMDEGFGGRSACCGYPQGWLRSAKASRQSCLWEGTT